MSKENRLDIKNKQTTIKVLIDQKDIDNISCVLEITNNVTHHELMDAAFELIKLASRMEDIPLEKLINVLHEYK